MWLLRTQLTVYTLRKKLPDLLIIKKKNEAEGLGFEAVSEKEEGNTECPEKEQGHIWKKKKNSSLE